MQKTSWFAMRLLKTCAASRAAQHISFSPMLVAALGVFAGPISQRGKDPMAENPRPFIIHLWTWKQNDGASGPQFTGREHKINTSHGGFHVEQFANGTGTGKDERRFSTHRCWQH